MKDDARRALPADRSAGRPATPATARLPLTAAGNHAIQRAIRHGRPALRPAPVRRDSTSAVQRDAAPEPAVQRYVAAGPVAAEVAVGTAEFIAGLFAGALEGARAFVMAVGESHAIAAVLKKLVGRFVSTAAMSGGAALALGGAAVVAAGVWVEIDAAQDAFAARHKRPPNDAENAAIYRSALSLLIPGQAFVRAWQAPSWFDKGRYVALGVIELSLAAVLLASLAKLSLTLLAKVLARRPATLALPASGSTAGGPASEIVATGPPSDAIVATVVEPTAMQAGGALIGGPAAAIAPIRPPASGTPPVLVTASGPAESTPAMVGPETGGKDGGGGKGGGGDNPGPPNGGGTWLWTSDHGGFQFEGRMMPDGGVRIRAEETRPISFRSDRPRPVKPDDPALARWTKDPAEIHPDGPKTELQPPNAEMGFTDVKRVAIVGGRLVNGRAEITQTATTAWSRESYGPFGEEMTVAGVKDTLLGHMFKAALDALATTKEWVAKPPTELIAEKPFGTGERAQYEAIEMARLGLAHKRGRPISLREALHWTDTYQQLAKYARSMGMQHVVVEPIRGFMVLAGNFLRFSERRMKLYGIDPDQLVHVDYDVRVHNVDPNAGEEPTAVTGDTGVDDEITLTDAERELASSEPEALSSGPTAESSGPPAFGPPGREMVGPFRVTETIEGDTLSITAVTTALPPELATPFTVALAFGADETAILTGLDHPNYGALTDEGDLGEVLLRRLFQRAAGRMSGLGIEIADLNAKDKGQVTRLRKKGTPDDEAVLGTRTYQRIEAAVKSAGLTVFAQWAETAQAGRKKVMRMFVMVE